MRLPPPLQQSLPKRRTDFGLATWKAEQGDEQKLSQLLRKRFLHEWRRPCRRATAAKAASTSAKSTVEVSWLGCLAWQQGLRDDEKRELALLFGACPPRGKLANVDQALEP